ncbi:MAG: hypothetical protein A2Z20_06400 [Bdellovibrionales bacterium RBG_16_40_8]|nr:MAG: hypothetical protein A2Z20_06400 [Bdellovibrionales bacterium RBG_16_40_8]
MNESEVVQPAPRIPLLLEVEFRRNYARRGEKGQLKNISISGAFLEIPDKQLLVPRDKLLITLIVSGRERRIPAHVVWSSNLGCGIKFQPTNNRDVQLVDDLMYFVENSRSSQRQVLDSIFKKVS